MCIRDSTGSDTWIQSPCCSSTRKVSGICPGSETTSSAVMVRAAAPARTITPVEAASLPGQIPLTFLVLEQQGDWLQVSLPVRPNGSTGWLKAADVTLSTTDYMVEVRLTEHRLLLHKADEVVLDVPVGVGRAEA